MGVQNRTVAATVPGAALPIGVRYAFTGFVSSGHAVTNIHRDGHAVGDDVEHGRALLCAHDNLA